MLLVLKLVTEVAVNQPEGMRSPLLAVALVGERSRKALRAAVANFLSSTDLPFAFFAAFCSTWSWVLEMQKCQWELDKCRDSVDLAFLWGNEQGNIVLKNILKRNNYFQKHGADIARITC